MEDVGLMRKGDRCCLSVHHLDVANRVIVVSNIVIVFVMLVRAARWRICCYPFLPINLRIESIIVCCVLFGSVNVRFCVHCNQK